MMAAGMIANQLGLFPAAALDAQQALLESFSLPTRMPATLDAVAILRRIASDKKVRRKRVRWVLPTDIGTAVVRDDVPEEVVEAVLQQMQNKEQRN